MPQFDTYIAIDTELKRSRIFYFMTAVAMFFFV